MKPATQVRRRLLAIALGVVGLQVGAAPAAAAEQGWQAPLDVSPGYQRTSPSIAADEDDGFVYTWNETRASDSLLEVKASLLPHSGPATGTQTIDGLAFFGTWLASDGQGRAIAVWDESSDPCCDGLSAALKEPGQSFSDPFAVPTGGNPTWAQVAMNDLGEAVIVYGLHHLDNSEELWAMFMAADGSLGVPLQVSESADLNFQDFDVGLSHNGEAAVAWASPEDDVIRAAIGTEAGFGPPVTLSDPTSDAYEAAVAIDASGGAVVAWDEPLPDFGAGGPVRIAVRIPGAVFGPATTLPLAAASGPGIDAGVSDDGHALVTYIDEQHRIVAAPVNTATAAVEPTQVIDPGYSSWARLGVAPDGETVVGSEYSIAAWGDASGAFGPLRTVACPPHSLLDVAVGSGGDAAMTLLDWGANIPDDVDDRVLVARSDTAIAPTSDPCPGDPIPPTPEPTPLPRLIFEMGKSIRLDRRGRLPITLASNAAGLLTVSGRARVGAKSGALKEKSLELAGPGSTTIKLKPPRRILRALRHRDPPKGEAVVEARLDAPSGPDSSTRRATVTFRPASSGS